MTNQTTRHDAIRAGRLAAEEGKDYAVAWSHYIRGRYEIEPGLFAGFIHGYAAVARERRRAAIPNQT